MKKQSANDKFQSETLTRIPVKYNKIKIKRNKTPHNNEMTSTGTKISC